MVLMSLDPCRPYNNQVSTVAQFRTLDFGMEHCVATLAIPSQEQIQDIPSKNISRFNDSFPLEIWALDAKDGISPQRLTWASRPARIGLLTTMVVRQGYNLLDSPIFPCPARSFLAFEIRCSSPTCRLRFRQDKKSPRLGKQAGRKSIL